MTASHHHPADIPARALGQSHAPDNGNVTRLPLRPRHEANDRPREGDTHGHRSSHSTSIVTPPALIAADVMTRDVVSVSTVTPVSEVAGVLARKRISAVPVINADGNLLGIVSESDLIRRSEIGTQRRRSWWRRIFVDTEREAADYVRTYGRKARHVMTPQVVTATEDMTLADVADIMERRRLKRLPVVRGKRLVGIVSRSDLVGALARHRAPPVAEPPTDDAILRDLKARVKTVTPSHHSVHLSVHRGKADIVGLLDSAAERQAIIVAAENTPGIRSVQDRTLVRSRMIS